MTTGPGCFADIGRKATKQLSKDYLPDDDELSEWSSGIIDSVCSLFTPNGGWLSKKSKQIELSYTDDISPSIKAIASVQIPNVRSSKVEFQFAKPNVTYTVARKFHKSPTLDVSAVIGSPTFALGVAAAYETSCDFPKFAAGISVGEPTSCASMILGDYGDTVEVSYIKRINEIKKTVVAGKIKRTWSTNTNNFIIGGTYAVDELTAVKAKVNSNGKLGAVLKLKLHPTFALKLSMEFDTKALKKSPKFDVFFSRKIDDN